MKTCEQMCPLQHGHLTLSHFQRHIVNMWDRQNWALRFREEQRGWSRAPELPCEGMGYEKAKKIGPPALRKHLTPPCWALYGQAAVCGPDTSPIVYQSEVTLLMSKVDKYIGVALD